jgi:cobalt-precorrin-5B (C1)-methyltransferase
MIAQALAEIVAAPDVLVTVSIPGGEVLAQKTLNPRLGIVGGLSILGTTGVVIPYSCAAWVHSIHRGIDVARAAGLAHIAAATGSTSERAVRALYDLPDMALIEMGDMVGATLKYLRRHPVARLTVAGGFAKLAKLAAGALDLHSRAGSADPVHLAGLARSAGADVVLQQRIAACHTAMEALDVARAADLPLAARVAAEARARCIAELRGTVAVEVVVVDREGVIVGRAGEP